MGYNLSLLDHESEEVDVTSESIEKILEDCKQELGLSGKYNLPHIKPRVVSDLMTMGASYVPSGKSIHSSPIVSEHVLFHELIHYLMDEEGLLINELLNPDNSYLVDYLCAHLIDETIAELATSNVFPYGTENDLVYSQNPLTDEINRVQADYLEGKEDLQDEKLDEAILNLCPSPFNNVNYREAVRVVAINNAIKLRENELSSSDIVTKLRESRKESSEPHELYFKAIVDCLE
ncbi:hypothetical protein HOE37_03640 [Candidatus Woesearchaeota archaeon]|jgi:hypothetical protein|nr:hypothetical protein [Candidatus Woesearchaeota archaeon]MBT4110923.1 hypothetical protein [Candidatus Woesearchaeota archaeon]MBT4336565.1 hypothetical protein [Candidatus Woesearchaeota archaeon]MBT4469686.1 hypothetical protein [Candidatus Woesearchaeota archaeon]MBT6744048.1 hypothetical protein [Candidatus Woesearchaeota archaeon]